MTDPDALVRLEKLAGQSCWSTTEAEFALQQLPDLLAKVREQGEALQVLHGAGQGLANRLAARIEENAALRAERDRMREALERVGVTPKTLYEGSPPNLVDVPGRECRFCCRWWPETKMFRHAPSCLLAEKEPDHGR